MICRPSSLLTPVGVNQLEDSSDHLPPSNSGIKDACEVNLGSHVCVHCVVPKQPGENGEAKGPVPNVDACSKYVS